MNINLDALLPDEKISDEMAYHLVVFFSELTLLLEDYYFTATKRYHKNNASKQPDDLQQSFDFEGRDPF